MFFGSVAGIVGSDDVMLFRGPDSLFTESAPTGGVGGCGV